MPKSTPCCRTGWVTKAGQALVVALNLKLDMHINNWRRTEWYSCTLSFLCVFLACLHTCCPNQEWLIAIGGKCQIYIWSPVVLHAPPSHKWEQNYWNEDHHQTAEISDILFLRIQQLHLQSVCISYSLITTSTSLRRGIVLWRLIWIFLILFFFLPFFKKKKNIAN